MKGRAIAIVGVGAILPDAPTAEVFWTNIKAGRYSVSEVTPDRWDSSRYFDPDPNAPDKTYSKIGGWVRDYRWDPVKWKLPIPPKVASAMDGTQRWAIACTRQALEDYGYPERALDSERTAVILGNAMAGEMHYLTAIRAYMPEYAAELEDSEAYAKLPEAVRKQIMREFQQRMSRRFPEITEDTMPGELSNCIAGRVANLFNCHGPNFVVDAACASAMAAINAAVEGLEENEFDLAITGGIDRNMGPSTFVKFCKIGALSATGSRPYAEGADGFVMGEGGVVLLLRRLADAERDGNKIYAVLRGIAGSSDGKGKGITAPNPVGQKLAIERAWANADLVPTASTLIEGHGTSTKVGDVVEVQSIVDVLKRYSLPCHSVALGSVKSNIGHLKAAAGAAGLLKATFALKDRLLPPSVNFERPNREIDFAHSPLFVNTALQEWATPKDTPRRAGVSAFGFGGTNFHTILEEYIPGKLNGGRTRSVVGLDIPEGDRRMAPAGAIESNDSPLRAPLRGALVIGAANEAELIDRLRTVLRNAQAGKAPPIERPKQIELEAAERIAIDFADAAELAAKTTRALNAFEEDKPAIWKTLALKGVFRGRGISRKIAFLFTGQGSQYVNMLRPFRSIEPTVAETFAEADEVLAPLLGKPLSHYIFVDDDNPQALARAEEDLRQTAITQPAVLATDVALMRMLGEYGIHPNFTMGHSLGEYGALVAAGALPFRDALEAVSARGKEMTRVSVTDNGKMAAVSGPVDEVKKVLATVDGYVVIANLNSDHQAVIGGASRAVEQAMAALQKAGFACVALHVSHAFHTSIVAPASDPLKRLLKRLHISPPRVPVIANVTGNFYPDGEHASPEIVETLGRQVESPVQFVKGLRTLYEAGARVFVEVGPKKALHSFVEDVLVPRGDVVALYTNHPKIGDLASFNQALCGLYAAGHGGDSSRKSAEVTMTTKNVTDEKNSLEGSQPATLSDNRYRQLGEIFADALERASKLAHSTAAQPAHSWEPVVITGAGLGLPGTERIFGDTNVERILKGEQFIDAIPVRFRRAMLDKNITRLVKSETGGPSFETIKEMDEVIKLAGRGGAFDPEKEFGISGERLAALDRTTRLAIAVGLEAMRDAGIPIVLRYKKTSKGTFLPDRWGLPDSMRDDTGVIFASAFPGYDSLIDQVSRYEKNRAKCEELVGLEKLLTRAMEANSPRVVVDELQHRIDDLRAAMEREPYLFDRRFLFRTLSMGHSQFAEFIGARGPNTAINSACATTTQAVSLAEDWIGAGRCKRVIIVSADDVTSDNMIEWIGAGFLATGAAATDEVLENAALPFDKRRHGMLIGMGAAALVVESVSAAAERGIRPICEVLSSVCANSAFHGTRLDVQHICDIMEKTVAQAERNANIDRFEIAPKLMFMSHETYTPARGGSASAEINALRRVFGKAADQIVIANTKGFTGHAMATGIEDVVAVKALETGVVPPVPNFKEVDPELGTLHLSHGGVYPVEFALRLGAGFGSQISMTLLRWTRSKDGSRPSASSLGYTNRIVDTQAWQTWLEKVSGHPGVTLEVVNRTLRVRDEAAAAVVSKSEETSRASEPKKIVPPKAVSHPDITIAAQESGVMPPSHDAVTAVRMTEVAEDEVKGQVLGIVAEKTGYATDMLDLDLDLEADLGIDTVKQAEVFAAIRERYQIPRDENRKLRDYPTLAHVIGFVLEQKKCAFKAPVNEITDQRVITDTRTQTEPRGSSTATTEDSIKDKLLDIVVQKTGYPREMLDVDLDLEADLGIDTVKQAELFAAIRELYNIPKDENRKLRDYPTLAHVIRFVGEHRPDLAPQPQEAPAKVPEAKADTNVNAARTEESHEVRTASQDEIALKVLQIVAEKTGYPTEMLDVELDLEADLGIDTVKQAEMFAAIRAEFGIPKDNDLKLRDFPTLQHVIGFAKQRSMGSSVPKAQAPTETGISPSHQAVSDFEAANRIPRRVPAPVPRPPLSICKATDVRLCDRSRIILMPDTAGVAEALQERLKGMGVEAIILERHINSDELTAQLKGSLAGGPIQGVYWLPALDVEVSYTKMSAPEWREAIQLRARNLYATMRALHDQIGSSGTFFISATRFGGQHGYDPSGAIAPLGGAVSGFTKAYKRERPDTICKVVDFELERTQSEIADALVSETLLDNGAVEIGYKHGQRWTVGLRETPADDGQPGMKLDRGSVFLVTGAAGSIVSAITADLALASGGTFYLVDLVPPPDPGNPDLKRFITDKEGLKREIFNRIQAKNQRATPVMVEKELASLERACAAQSAIDAVRLAGGTAKYHSLDVRDPDAISKLMATIRRESGRIDVLLHGAGVERSHFLPDKPPEEFDLVFDVKAASWFHLMHAIGDMPLKATVVFSSVAGRFGNAGQTDYSAANDFLCKMTSHLRNARPATRAIAIDWTAWAGIGMATRGSIPKMMEVAGIDMLPPEAGIPLIRRELTTGGTRGEVVIGQRLGTLLQEWDTTGGVDREKASAVVNGPMLGQVKRLTTSGEFEIETTLDPVQQPFLRDHRIDGTAVLPGVMGIEAFAEAAKAVMPGWTIDLIEDVKFLAPIKFYRDEPRTLLIRGVVVAENDCLLSNCTLIGSRVLPNQKEPQTTTHFSARVRLTRGSPSKTPLMRVPGEGSPSITAADIYKVYFHGPAYRVLDRVWMDGDTIVGRMPATLPPNHQPPHLPTLMEPRLIELGFQTASLLQMLRQNVMGLPRHVDEVRIFAAPKTTANCYAVASGERETFNVSIVDGNGSVCLQVKGYGTVAVPLATDVKFLRILPEENEVPALASD